MVPRITSYIKKNSIIFAVWPPTRNELRVEKLNLYPEYCFDLDLNMFFSNDAGNFLGFEVIYGVRYALVVDQPFWKGFWLAVVGARN